MLRNAQAGQKKAAIKPLEFKPRRPDPFGWGDPRPAIKLGLPNEDGIPVNSGRQMQAIEIDY